MKDHSDVSVSLPKQTDMKKVNAKRKRLHRRGIEPRSPAWQARILPLNHQCLGGKEDKLKKKFKTSHPRQFKK